MKPAYSPLGRREVSLRQIYDPVETERALLLRHDCYVKRGKLSGASGLPSSTYEAARPGTLVGIYVGEALAGTVRLHAPGAYEQLESVDGRLGYYPASFPARHELIEVSQLAILPEYRGLATFQALYSAVHRFLVENNRAWILIAADPVLSAKYRCIGFRATGLGYRKEGSRFPDVTFMLSCQKRLGTYGLHADPVRWNLFLREITEQLVREGKLRHNRWQRLVFSCYRLFRPLSPLFLWAAKLRWVRV